MESGCRSRSVCRRPRAASPIFAQIGLAARGRVSAGDAACFYQLADDENFSTLAAQVRLEGLRGRSFQPLAVRESPGCRPCCRCRREPSTRGNRGSASPREPIIGRWLFPSVDLIAKLAGGMLLSAECGLWWLYNTTRERPRDRGTQVSLSMASLGRALCSRS